MTALLSAASRSAGDPETAAVAVARVRDAPQTGDREVMLSLAAALDA